LNRKSVSDDSGKQMKRLVAQVEHLGMEGHQ